MFSVVRGCCGKIPTLAVEAEVHIYSSCDLDEFPRSTEVQNGDGFTNSVEFHLEEIKACMQVPDTQADPNPFFFLFLTN